jgi:hypothetical protein
LSSAHPYDLVAYREPVTLHTHAMECHRVETDCQADEDVL